MVVLLLSTASFPCKETVLSVDQSKYCKQVTSKNRYFSTHKPLRSSGLLQLSAVILFSSRALSTLFRFVRFLFVFARDFSVDSIFGDCPLEKHAKRRGLSSFVLCEGGQTRPGPQNETLTFGLSLK